MTRHRPSPLSSLILAVLLVLVLIVGVVQSALAQGEGTHCAVHAVMTEMLAERYGEARQTIALAASGVVIETWSNLDSGTWTVTMTAPEGPTCLVLWGQAFELTHETTPAGEEGRQR